MYKRILVPLDGSSLAECVIPHVKNIACPDETEVELISVAEPVDIPTRGEIALSEEDINHINSDIKEKLHNYLDKISEKMEQSHIKVSRTIVSGKAADSLISYAEDNEIDMIIMATHGHSGIKKWFWGSVAEKVLRAVHIPVLIIKTSSSEAEV